jgi:hypothetical protein
MPAYPREQMHRIAYTKLTTDQISDKLAQNSGPISASPLSDALAGRSLKIVTDNGPTLDYSFSSANRLALAENGGAGVEAGYGALKLHHLVVFSHLVPGTQRGYHVIVDEDTRLATVFETWFSGEVTAAVRGETIRLDANREVQREVYFGYVDDGSGAPERRHVRTNRAEGKGFYWKQDTGVETLEFYPSYMFSNFVELSRLGGELGFCAPSDYIQVNDDLYIYSRTECEMSGVFTLYALDVNTVEQAGVRLGFNADDALEYYVFNGRGEWLGQIAQFEKFGDTKGAVMPPNADGSPLPKGARRVYRPMATYTLMSKEEVAEAARNPRIFAPSAMAGNKGPISDFLSGKQLTLRWDNGSAIEYQFASIDTLSWRREGENRWTEEKYESWESTPGVIMFGHLMTGAPDHDCQIVVADFDHGLATLLHGTMGTPYINNEAAVKTIFGVVEMEGLTPPKYRRHQFTDELVGRCITWNYSQETGLTSMHHYTTPHSLSWIIFGADGAGGMEWSGPSAQVKIRDGVYLAYWLEEACNGTLGTILINMRTMHDCGVGYHCGPDLSLSSVGAHARHAGRWDTARFFQIKA